MAARQPPDWEHGQRRSIPYFPDTPAEELEDASASGFVEDIWLTLLPNQVQVRIEPEANVLPRFEEIFPSRDEFGPHLDERITDFIEDAAQSLAADGEVWYELVRPPVPGTSPPFVLAKLPRGKITPLPWWVIQQVPRASRERIRRRHVTIPRRDTWHLTLPRELGSSREHRAVLRLLGRLFPPEFSIEAMRPGATTAYDFSVHHRAREVLVAAVTRRWGWTGRGMWLRESSQYFMDYRTLRFRRAQVLIRTHLINEINGLLRREGLANTIVLDGLATVETIDVLLGRLDETAALPADALEVLRQ